MTADLTLFDTCPVCRRNPVDDPRIPCGECRAAFGEHLKPSAEETTADEFRAAMATGDERVARVMTERYATAAAPAEVPAPEDPPLPLPGEWRRNQTCWCCEERRTCRQDPASSNGWICKDCEAIQ